MARKQGDLQKKAVKSLSEIGQDLASSIAKKDARYQQFWNYVPVPALMKPDGFFRDRRKTQALFGGNKSTKTTSAVFKCIMIYTGIIPPSMQGVYGYEKELSDISPGGKNHRPRHVRIVVMDINNHWPTVIKPLLLGNPETGAEGMLPEAWSDYNKDEHMFYGPDESWLQIFPVKPDETTEPRGLRGPLIDHTLTDELNRRAIWTESLTRGVSLKGGPKTYDHVYCPQEGFECWTYEDYYAPNFNKVTKKKKPIAEQHPDINANKVCMRDNPSIPQSEIDKIVSSLKPWEIAFRVDGEYSSRADNPYFDMDTLVAWEEEQRCYWPSAYEVIEDVVDEDTGVFKGHFEKIKGAFNSKEKCAWYVWEMPKHGNRYVISADLAEGNQEGDASSISVWNCTDQEKPYQAAQIRTKNFRAGDLAIQSACVGKIYGGANSTRYALIVPEKNNTAGGQFTERIRNYRNMYMKVQGSSQQEKQTDVLGWFTDGNSKGPMLDDAYKMLKKMAVTKDEYIIDGQRTFRNFCPFRSPITLLEFMAYEERVEKNNAGQNKIVWGARKGAHDDTVMEAAIAFRIIKHEYYKICACILERKDQKILTTESLIDKAIAKHEERSSKRNIRKQPDLGELRKKMRVKHG